MHCLYISISNIYLTKKSYEKLIKHDKYEEKKYIFKVKKHNILYGCIIAHK